MSRKIYAQTALAICATLAETEPQTRAAVATLALQEIVEITSTSDDILMMPGEAPFDQSLDHMPKRPAPQQHSVFRAEKSFRQRIAADPLPAGLRVSIARDSAICSALEPTRTRGTQRDGLDG